jgi:hypothetical protein
VIDLSLTDAECCLQPSEVPEFSCSRYVVASAAPDDKKSLTHAADEGEGDAVIHHSQQIPRRRHVVLRGRAFSNACDTFVVEKPLSALHVE